MIEVIDMAYSVKSVKSGKSYFLHSQRVTLRGNGKEQTIFYFAGKVGTNAVAALPAGYQVIESARTGLPILKKLVKQAA